VTTTTITRGAGSPKLGPVEPLNGSCLGLTLPVVSVRLVAESTVELPYGERAKISTPADAAAILRPYFKDKATEEFLVLLLNTAGIVTALGRVSVGGLAGCVVEPRAVFQHALEGNAASIILAHNHPSGNPEPSENDIALTRQLVEAGKVMGIPVLDHVIVAGSAHSSVMQYAIAPLPAALGTLPSTTPEPMPTETRRPALRANEPRAGYTPKIPRVRRDATLMRFGHDAIDELLAPHTSPINETIRYATRLVCLVNHGDYGADIRDEIEGLISVLYCTPNYGAALLPFEVEQHLRQAMRPGNSAAISDGPSVNEPGNVYTAETVHPDEAEAALDCLSDNYTWIELLAFRLIRVGLPEEAEGARAQLPNLNKSLRIVEDAVYRVNEPEAEYTPEPVTAPVRGARQNRSLKRPHLLERGRRPTLVESNGFLGFGRVEAIAARINLPLAYLRPALKSGTVGVCGTDVLLFRPFLVIATLLGHG